MVFYPTISDRTTEIIIRRHIEGIKKLLHPQYGNVPTNTTPEEEEADLNPKVKQDEKEIEQAFARAIKPNDNDYFGKDS